MRLFSQYLVSIKTSIYRYYAGTCWYIAGILLGLAGLAWISWFQGIRCFYQCLIQYLGCLYAVFDLGHPFFLPIYDHLYQDLPTLNTANEPTSNGVGR